MQLGNPVPHQAIVPQQNYDRQECRINRELLDGHTFTIYELNEATNRYIEMQDSIDIALLNEARGTYELKYREAEAAREELLRHRYAHCCA